MLERVLSASSTRQLLNPTVRRSNRVAPSKGSPPSTTSKQLTTFVIPRELVAAD